MFSYIRGAVQKNTFFVDMPPPPSVEKKNYFSLFQEITGNFLADTLTKITYFLHILAFRTF